MKRCKTPRKIKKKKILGIFFWRKKKKKKFLTDGPLPFYPNFCATAHRKSSQYHRDCDIICPWRVVDSKTFTH